MQASLKILSPLKRYSMESAIAVLLAVLYAPLVLYWVDGWLNKSISIEHEYFSYALIGFPYAILATWQLRQRWHQLPARNNLFGLALLILGSISYLSPLQNLINLSLPILLSSLVLTSKGWAGLRLMGFPLLLVVLATPTDLPYLIAPYLMPLQRMISTIVGFILIQGGMTVTVDQIYILVNERIVEVAPYCAGLKMLMTSLYVALILLHWTGNLRSRTKTGMLLVGAAVISVVGNIIRNTLLTFFHGTDQTSLFDWLHAGWGGDVFSALLLLSVLMLSQGVDSAENALSIASSRYGDNDSTIF
ncbi:cyanoexosortase B [Nodosilinea sp. LEGE 07088]|uniref:cyanoexosortase B n=1 Tax=Nodosilinea sp. LEGE 07088 TaxID=2777968 RepID=UPI00187E0D07|nr:cyanoexosortase B [Nodosilinea sp. LEGE 07088]MBE9135703.1 cyanoexosortase B [Nodosilinea sp. LEGE 07088]